LHQSWVKIPGRIRFVPNPHEILKRHNGNVVDLYAKVSDCVLGSRIGAFKSYRAIFRPSRKEDEFIKQWLLSALEEELRAIRADAGKASHVIQALAMTGKDA